MTSLLGVTIIISLGLGSLFVYLYHQGSLEYEDGQKLLDNATVSVNFVSPDTGSKFGRSESIINGTQVTGNAIRYELFYVEGPNSLTASSSYLVEWANQNGYDVFRLGTYSGEIPSKLPSQKIDLADALQKFGNNAQVCAVVDLTYKRVNFIYKLFNGSPKKTLADCATITAQFAN